MTSFVHTALATSRAALDEHAHPAARLLIVDAVAGNSAALSRRFEKTGFEIVEADCGAEALRLVQDQSFDVTLLDKTMPDMSGTEVLRRIRRKFPPSLLPVIMVTPDSQAEDVIEATKIGANDYLTKPIDFSIAQARVNNQVARRRAGLEFRGANSAAKPNDRGPSTARLLIVDDIADNGAVLSRRFVKRGFEIVEADGAEALRLAQQQPWYSAWAIFAVSSSTRSRSISPSFRKCSDNHRAARSCEPPSASEETSACVRRPRASKPSISSNTLSAKAAPKCKASCSARRNRMSKSAPWSTPAWVSHQARSSAR